MGASARELWVQPSPSHFISGLWVPSQGVLSVQLRQTPDTLPLEALHLVGVQQTASAENTEVPWAVVWVREAREAGERWQRAEEGRGNELKVRRLYNNDTTHTRSRGQLQTMLDMATKFYRGDGWAQNVRAAGM
ncbi:hypothetical protein B0H14DRAFT_3125536 [Mycena olivaceomarginata]|nr:hypothetical protein B0H14DRAFT_3125536 [Mycena olivaceomarginata]